MELRWDLWRNFWHDIIYVPASVTYFSEEDRSEAKSCFKRWNSELAEKKTGEIEAFNGKREINEGETASTVSQSKFSNTAERGQNLAQSSQQKFGGLSASSRRLNDARRGGTVQFADEDGSRSPSPDFARDGRDEIRVIDEALAGGDDVDFMDRRQLSLGELSRHKSKDFRD